MVLDELLERLGATYSRTWSYNAETSYVLGEFYWPVRRGQKTFNRDYAVGDRILSLDADRRARIAAALGLSRLPAARLEATIAATGQEAWTLTGRLTARVVQPCVVTLAPVETPIAEDVRRVYSPHAAAPEGDDVASLLRHNQSLVLEINQSAAHLPALGVVLARSVTDTVRREQVTLEPPNPEPDHPATAPGT